MRPTEADRLLKKFPRAPFPAVAPFFAIVFMCVALSACVGDYCIQGVFNPGVTVTGNSGSCVNNKAMGTVSLRIAPTAASSDAPMAPNFLHLYVTLKGIEAHPDAIAPENSPDWEELAPDLAREPRQFDLLASPANSCATNRIPEAHVSAGAYRQIRLQLIPNHPSEGDAVPATNACGELGFHCAVSPDGQMHHLAFANGATSLSVSPDRISGGSFHVLPDMDTHLTIEFNSFASLAASSGDAIQITPAFTVEPAASCSTAAASEP